MLPEYAAQSVVPADATAATHAMAVARACMTPGNLSPPLAARAHVEALQRRERRLAARNVVSMRYSAPGVLRPRFSFLI